MYDFLVARMRIADATDLEMQRKQDEERERELALNRRSTVLKKELPRPKALNMTPDLKFLYSNSEEKDLAKAEEMVQGLFPLFFSFSFPFLSLPNSPSPILTAEMLKMLSHDHAKYPVPGSKQKFPSSAIKEFTEMSEEDLAPARKAVLEELEKDDETLLESLVSQSKGQAYEACSDSFFFAPSQRGYVQAGVSTGGLQVFFFFFFSPLFLFASHPPLPLPVHILISFFNRWKASSLNSMLSETKFLNTPPARKRSKRKWAFILRGLSLATLKFCKKLLTCLLTWFV